MELKIITILLKNHCRNLYNTEPGNGRTSADCFDFGCIVIGGCTANAYRQTTDKLMFKSVISTVR